jgi:hypothetical protein
MQVNQPIEVGWEVKADSQVKQNPLPRQQRHGLTGEEAHSVVGLQHRVLALGETEDVGEHSANGDDAEAIEEVMSGRSTGGGGGDAALTEVEALSLCLKPPAGQHV